MNQSPSLKRLHRLFFPRLIVRRRVRRRRNSAATVRSYNMHKEEARTLIHERLSYFNLHYGFPYNRVTIRAQRSRWGSCSKKGNLNFNYTVLFLPPELCDAVIVHELCHLKEFNHGKAFWQLVGETIPDYAERKKRLARTHPDRMRPIRTAQAV